MTLNGSKVTMNILMPF